VHITTGTAAETSEAAPRTNRQPTDRMTREFLSHSRMRPADAERIDCDEDTLAKEADRYTGIQLVIRPPATSMVSPVR
jgi:hypothetical protein